MTMTKDPVCKVSVDADEAARKNLSSDFDGQTYHFCSTNCKRAFDAEPQQYAPPIRWPEDWETQETEQPIE